MYVISLSLGSKMFAKVPELVHVFIILKVSNYNDCY